MRYLRVDGIKSENYEPPYAITAKKVKIALNSRKYKPFWSSLVSMWKNLNFRERSDHIFELPN